MFGWFRKKPTREGFARAVQDGVRALKPDLAVSYDADEAVLRFGESGQVHLGNLFQQYAQLSRREQGELVAMLAGMIATPDVEIPPWEEARTRVLPRLHSRLFVDSTRLGHEQTPALVVPTRPVAEHLVVSLVYDLSDRMMYVNQGQLDRWGIGLDEGLEAARSQLWRRSNRPFREAHPGYFVSAWQDNYDASRLVLQSLLWQLKVKGTPVALARDRDHLLVTGSEDEAGLRRLLEAAREGSQYPVSSEPVWLRDEQWEPWTGPGWEEHLRRCRGGLYAEQREMLLRNLARLQQDVFVADCSAVAHKERGLVFTYCVVAPEVTDALLPETDSVVLALPEARRVAWPAFREVLGERLERTEHWPPRWRLRGKLETPLWEELAGIGEPL